MRRTSLFAILLTASIAPGAASALGSAAARPAARTAPREIDRAPTGVRHVARSVLAKALGRIGVHPVAKAGVLRLGRPGNVARVYTVSDSGGGMPIIERVAPRAWGK